LLPYFWLFHFTDHLFCFWQIPDGVVFAEWDENTLSSGSRYTCTSDLYQVGRIMKKFPPDKLSVGGAQLRDKLLGKAMKTANEALAHAWVACPGSCEGRR
jgi:hypothetical protein